LNLLGRDIKLSGGFLFGGVTTFSADMSYPWISGNHRSVDLSFAHLNRQDDLNGFKEKSDEFSPWVGTYIGSAGRARLGFSWFQMRSDVDGKTLDPGNKDDFFRIGGALGVDTRDSWRNPHRGWWSTVEVIRTGLFGGSSGEYWAGHLDIRRFLPTIQSQTLMLGGLVSLQSGTPGVDFPEYLYYRMGGANSIRGYNIDELGRTLFGKNQMIYTLEYQFRVRPIQEYRILNWSVSLGLQLAFFLDSGVAWNAEHELAWNRIKTGGGVGFRLLVPGADMVRFDVGIGDTGELRFHLASGNKLEVQRDRLR
jgi:outer membrane protein assembly factor BamA